MRIANRDLIEEQNRYYEPDKGFKAWVMPDKITVSKKGYWLINNALSKSALLEFEQALINHPKKETYYIIYDKFPDCFINEFNKINAGG